jgi:hypothetical protein
MTAHRQPHARRAGTAFLVALLLASIWPSSVSADPVFPPPEEEVTQPPDHDTLLGEFHPLTGRRIFSTAAGLNTARSKIGAGSTRKVDVTGKGGVPANGAAAVVLNVTVSSPTRAGSVTLYPAGSSRPAASNLQFSAGETTSNLVVVKVGANGNVTLHNAAGSIHASVAVAGWYGETNPADGGQASPLTGRRIFSTATGQNTAKARIGAGSTRQVDVTGQGGVPDSGAAAVVLNVTVSSPTRAGSVTLYPAGSSRPAASNLQFAAGETISNLVVVKVGANGNVALYNRSGSIHASVAVAGWYTLAGAEPDEGAVAGAAGAVPAARGDVGRTSEFETSLAGAILEDPLSSAPAEAADLEPSQGDLGLLHTDGPPLDPDRAGYETSVSPAVGRLYMVNGSNQVVGTCSGTVVARNLVLTAAHCVYSHTYGGYFEGFWFYPQLLGSSFSYGAWFTANGVTFDIWRNSANWAFDYAFLQFNTPNVQGNLLGDVTGSFPILYNSAGGPKYSIGYPSEGWFGKEGRCTNASCWPYHCEARILDGSTQYKLDLADSGVSYGGWWEVGFGCWMTGGSSGGPVFEYYDGRWYVNGVNSHLLTTGAPTYSQGCTRPGGVCYEYARGMWSPYFNEVALQVRNQYAIP